MTVKTWPKYNFYILGQNVILCCCCFVVIVLFCFLIVEPCIENVFIVMDRSSGIGNPQLYDAMYMIEILLGALLRNSRNLTITIVSYATTLYQRSNLEKLSVNLTSGTTITEETCIDALKDYESKLIKTFKNKPRDTVSGRTLELLVSDIEKGTLNTVITFAGTVSNYELPDNNPVTRIGEAILSMKEKVGENNVRFFSAGFYAENGDDRDKAQYEAEVLALADNTTSHNNIAPINIVSKEPDPITLMSHLTDSLYNNGVLCKEQSK